MVEAIVVVLILLMTVGALVAIETPNLLYSVISVGAVGFLLSIVFLFLSAPDLAITQIAVEVITLVILLRAVVPTGRHESERCEADADETDANETEADETDEAKKLWWGRLAAAVAVILLCMGSGRMLAEFPPFGVPVTDRFVDAPSNTYLRDGLEQTGAANIVTAVLLDFRGYDTLGEATVLFCAVMGALSVLRPKAKVAVLDAEDSP